MKKSIVLLAIPIVLVTSFLFTSCKTPTEKVKNAKEDVAKANKNLEDAKEAYLSDMESYRRETVEKINANNKTIEAFNQRILNGKKEVRADYRSKVLALEKKNTDMQKRMDDYKADGKRNWESFKLEFSRDMEELGIALKNLAADNV